MTDVAKVVESSPGRARWWPGYIVAIVATFATLWVRLAMDTMLGGRPTLVIFTIPIMLAAYFGGFGQGLLATLLSYLVASYYLLPPIHSFTMDSPVDRWQQAFFVLAGVVISGLNEALHRARRHTGYAVAGQRRAEATTVQLGAIVESSDDAIISKDFNSIITSWNRGAEKIFGYASGEMRGTSIMRLIPGDRQEEENHIMAEIRRGQSVPHFETVRRTKDGRLLNVSVSVSPIKDGAGNLIGASKIARDITLEKIHEREIARLIRLYAALSQVNQAIVVARDRDALFAKICRALVEHGGFQLAWVGLLNSSTQRVLPVSQWGDKLGYVTHSEVYADDRPEGQGPVGTAVREGRTYVCNDFAADPRTLPWREAAERAGYRSSAALPIRQEGAVCGSINVYASEIGYFKDREIALLEEAAGDVSFGLDNLVRDRIRGEAEESLRASEARYHALFEYAPDGIVIADPESTYLDANASACRMLGYARAELVGLHATDIVVPEEIQHIAPALSAIKASSDYHREWRFRRKDGSTFAAEVIATRMPDGNLLGMIRDITEQRTARQKIQDQLDELLRWQEVMINREGRVDALKVEVNAELARQGQPLRYAKSPPP